MKFRCEKSVFVEMINAALHAITSKSTIPALEGILIEAGDELVLTGFDLEVGIRCRNYAEISEKGSIVVNGRLLSDIIRKLPDEIVTFSCDEKLYVTISCGVSVFNLIGISPSDYPELPAVQRERYTTLPQSFPTKPKPAAVWVKASGNTNGIISPILPPTASANGATVPGGMNGTTASTTV